MSRPAGFSDSEEDSDYEQFGFEPVRRAYNVNHIQERVWSPEEKLFDAVRKNDVVAVSAALAEGADIHYRMKENTPIMEAACEGHLAVMTVLIENGANINDDHNMTTVLMRLCTSWSRNEEELLSCLRLLLEHGADPKATDWTTVPTIMMATRSNHLLLVSHLVEIGCDVNSCDPDGITPLSIAVQNENLAMVEFLLEAGADPNVIDRRGNSLAEIPQVNANPELAALLGIKIDDDAAEEMPQPVAVRSNFKRAMASGPKKTDRMYGFHEDALRFVKGIGLYDIADILEDKNVQFAELLTWSDEDLERLGIAISYYKRKIAFSVKKYHEQPWGKGAIPVVSNVKSDGQVDLFLVVLFFLDFLRVQHISSATSLYMLKNVDGPLTAEVRAEIKHNLATLSLAKKLLRTTKQFCVSESAASMPPDLISTSDLPKTNSSGFCLHFVGFFFKMYTSWNLPWFLNI